MTYKERYYRDHKNDKKPLSTRLIELAVELIGTIAYLTMIACIVVGIGKQPLVWWLTFIGSIAICLACVCYACRYEGDDDK